MVLSTGITLSITVLILASVVFSSKSEIKDETDTKSDNQCDPLFLTPYINAGKLAEAKELSQVHKSDYTGSVESYSGYLTVNKSCNSNLFFWFFPAENNYKTAPVILWLQGGPGDPLMYGVLKEIGPFYWYNNSELRSREYSWSSNNSVLFIDNPVGAGYSFTDKDECYARNQNDIRINLYEALIQFFTLFSELEKNEFYICGESYGGKYVISLGYSIYENRNQSSIKINLQGLGISSGVIDPINSLVFSKHLYQLGLIDDFDKKEIHKLERLIASLIKEEKWQKAYDSTSEIISYIQRRIRTISIYNYSRTKSSAGSSGFSQFRKHVTNHKLKCAIHVGTNASFDQNSVSQYLQQDEPKSVKPWVEILIENYKMLFYNGQFDIIVGFPQTRRVTQKLNWSGKNLYLKARYKQYTLENDTICGFIKRYKNLNVALVRNAGHVVSHDQPECTYELIKNYLLNNNKQSKKPKN